VSEHLVETLSGLLVPESALPPLPSNVDLSGTFDSKEAAEKWVAKCVVRWEWAISMDHVNYARPDEEPVFKARAYRKSGQIHDTTMESYEQNSEDKVMTPYVEVSKEETGDESHPFIYRVVNKF